MAELQTDWLRCFVAAVDAGSLSSAAPEIHRSQSAVSMQIQKLEAVAGCRLLLRGPRQLRLTPERPEGRREGQERSSRWAPCPAPRCF